MRVTIFVALTSLFVGTAVFAETHECTKFSLPSLQPGCQGEGCGTIEYSKSIKTVKVYKEPSISSSVIDTLKKCEPIKDFKSFIVISATGHARILEFRNEAQLKSRPGPRLFQLNVGDIIPLIFYEGEGYFKACVENVEFRVGDPGGLGEIIIDVDERPKVRGWVKLRTPRAHEGFVAESEDFYLHHYTYDKSLLCLEDQ